jgi:alpha-ketoglutarate-dependent taurine dioxygenase
MLKTYKINKSKTYLINKFVKDWKNEDNKVFYFTGAKLAKKDVRTFYTTFFQKIIEFKNFAEDAQISNRNNQRTNSIWMEVRFDPKIKNAYRHSSNSQPLHTDGSYIKKYTNSTLMCCEKNNTKKGETTFISAFDIFRILKKKNKSLLNNILKYPVVHARSGDTKKSKVLYKSKNKWKLNWNFFCIKKNQSLKIKNMINEFKFFLDNDLEIKTKTLPIKMKAGDALVWKDSEILHGRNGFVANKESDRFIWKCAANF